MLASPASHPPPGSRLTPEQRVRKPQLGKRVLLFVPPNSSHLPSTLRRFSTVRANISNREAVQFALDRSICSKVSL
jgi:hypothetical protein